MDFVTASTGLISPYWMGLPIRYIHLKEKELILHTQYPLDIKNMTSSNKTILNIILNKYHGTKIMDSKDMKIILFIE